MIKFCSLWAKPGTQLHQYGDYVCIYSPKLWRAWFRSLFCFQKCIYSRTTRNKTSKRSQLQKTYPHCSSFISLSSASHGFATFEETEDDSPLQTELAGLICQNAATPSMTQMPVSELVNWDLLKNSSSHSKEYCYICRVSFVPREHLFLSTDNTKL